MGSSYSLFSKRQSKKEASDSIQSKRAKFFLKYQCQSFSLPDSIMLYIAKNPTTPELYQKMVQTCKYFYVKNPILVTSNLDYCGFGKWHLSCIHHTIYLSQIVSKLWITNFLGVLPVDFDNNQNLLLSVMPKLYKCDAKIVFFTYETISFQDLSLLISSAEDIQFDNVTVKNKDGSNAGIEKIVEVAVKAKRIDIFSLYDTALSNITSETMKEFLKIPHFSKLDELTMKGIPEAFDLETFYGYMTKNKTTKFSLRFHDSISQAYKNRLEEIVDEIIATETRDYKPPLIAFDGIDEEKWEKLNRILSSPN